MFKFNCNQLPKRFNNIFKLNKNIHKILKISTIFKNLVPTRLKFQLLTWVHKFETILEK